MAARAAWPPAGLTLRSAALAGFLGTMLCFSNTYFGLQTGWVTMGSLQSALLSFGLVQLQQRMREGTAPLSIAEHVMVVTMSTASATMPLAAGFVGIIPALRILQARGEGVADSTMLPLQSPGSQILWSLSVCLIGVFIAVPLRTYLRTLRFPSGTATAVAISTLHSRDGVVSLALDTEGEAGKGGLGEEGPHALTAHMSTTATATIGDKAECGSGEVCNAGGVTEVPPPVSLRLAWVSFIASAILSVCGAFVPVLGGVPICTWLGFPGATSWSWVVTLSLSYVGQGMIMGTHTCVSMAGGALLAWGVIGPSAQAAGWIKGKPLSSGPTGGRGFLLWISLAILLSEASASALIALWGVMRRDTVKGERKEAGPASSSDGKRSEQRSSLSSSDSLSEGMSRNLSSSGDGCCDAATHGVLTFDTWPSEGDYPAAAMPAAQPSAMPPAATIRVPSKGEVLPTWLWSSGLVITSVIAIIVVIPLAGISFGEALLAVAFSLPISVIAVRALGETDLNPVSGLGKITQLVFGLMFPANLVGNVIAGAIAEAGAQQAGDLMQDLKMGLLLEVSLPAQFIGQVIGTLISAFSATLAFAVFDAAYGVPSLSLPAPTAALWVSMAEVMGGNGSLPSHVIPFLIVATAMSFCITLATSAHAPRALASIAAFLPSPTAFSIGVYVSPNWTLPRLAGAGVAALLTKRYTGSQTIVLIATGFVLGEGCAALLMALGTTLGVRPLTCGGCAVGMCGNWCP